MTEFVILAVFSIFYAYVGWEFHYKPWRRAKERDALLKRMRDDA